MALNIFLSLSFVDASVVRAVFSRLPKGVARFYERSFERGDDILEAMEKGLDASEVFVLFASKGSLASYAVNFEINEARYRAVEGKVKKVLVFPIEPDVTFGSLPGWLKRGWVPNVGETPADIARYLTTVLLEPDRGLSIAAPKVVGRGAMLDLAERAAASHLQRYKATPRTYIFSGLTGIGRRTFAAYYLRRALSSEANLPFGPAFNLSAQAELIDIYRALRTEIDPLITPDTLAEEQAAFTALHEDLQIKEIIRVSRHFAKLGQAITIASAAGFFEDAGHPKAWVKPLLRAFPDDQFVVIITNLQFTTEYIDSLGVAVQLRIKELEEEDVRALMIFTAELLGVKDFTVSDKLLAAIGGHADVANAAVKLALQKGGAILERDPSQLFNIQQAIIGDIVHSGKLTTAERAMLDVLGWLPGLGANLLEEIIVRELGISDDDFDQATESLILSCLIYVTKYQYSIAPSVRQYYRRFNVTDSKVLAAMANVLSRQWQAAQDEGFRDDLFAAFVFMQVMEGKSLPPELRRLLTPGNLHDAVRDAYARGKQAEDEGAIKQAISWGQIAIEMPMSHSVREEILSTVARAQIRIRDYAEAAKTIELMRRSGYRSVTFLEGHALRKQRKFEEAIPKLRFVVDNFRHNKAAVHELALCYRRLRKSRELEALLKEHGDAVRDSPIFLDFMIGLNISRGELSSVPLAIERLRVMDESPDRANLRYAQYLMRRGNNKGAAEYLSHILETDGRGGRRLRALRSIATARAGNYKIARADLEMLRALPGYEAQAASIETQILFAEGKLREALDLSFRNPPEEPGDWLVRASILEALANSSDASLPDGNLMRNEAAEIRAEYASDVEFFED